MTFGTHAKPQAQYFHGPERQLNVHTVNYAMVSSMPALSFQESLVLKQYIAEMVLGNANTIKYVHILHLSIVAKG